MASNYTILGVERGATELQIKKRFRTLCKELHPDRTGGDKVKTEMFIKVQAAYEALLKGDTGEQEAYNMYKQQEGSFRSKSKPKAGEYRFEGIKKDDNGYLVSFFVKGVAYIEIFGEKGNKVGHYTVRGEEGILNLRITWEAAKEAKYVFECHLNDDYNRYAKVTYKVKPPKLGFFEKVKKFFDFLP